MSKIAQQKEARWQRLLAKRVARGATYLDKVNPLWFHKINLETLDLNSGKNCIIGQLYGTFDCTPTNGQSGYRDAFPRASSSTADRKVESHGFVCWPKATEWDMVLIGSSEHGLSLQEYWLLEIAERKEEAAKLTAAKIMHEVWQLQDATRKELANAL